MAEKPTYTYTEADHEAYDRLDREGQLTGAQIRQRLGMGATEHVEIEPVPEPKQPTAELHARAASRHRRPLSWRERLGADEAPEHIRRQIR